MSAEDIEKEGSPVPVTSADQTSTVIQPSTEQAVPKASLWVRHGVRRVGYAAWSLTVAMLFAQSVVGAVAFLGWVMRWMQREVLKSWWKQSVRGGQSSAWTCFLESAHWTRQHVVPPRWFISQERGESGQGMWNRIRCGVKHCCGSLVTNVRLGLQAIFNVWVFTIPGCLLWLFAWYDGWNNSFNKGYEQALVGPLTGLLGVGLFIASMLYVPMAQARQAATGDWRRFYDFKFVSRLARREWMACTVLAGFYSALTLPVMVLKTAPSFFTQWRPEWALLSSEEAAAILKTYWFWAGMVLVLSFVVLRLFAARIYARGVLRGVRRGAFAEDDLAPVEWETLQRLGLLAPGPTSEPAWWLRILAWVGKRVGGAAALFVTVALWFSLVAQIFISEFFIYHPFLGWMNQPTVQLPYFKYMPVGTGDGK